MTQDAVQEPAPTQRRIPKVGDSPYDEVHLATDVIGYRVAELSEPLPVHVPDEQHVDVAIGRITARRE